MIPIFQPIYTALVSLVPALLCWLWGRDLARLADDPALPERLLANRSRNGLAVSSAYAVILVLAPPAHWLWSLPLIVLTRMAAQFPLRKTLYQESWGLVSYFSFFLRLTFAGLSFWMLVAVLPTLMMLAGSHQWIVAVVLVPIVFAWAERYPDIFRTLIRARPIDDSSLIARFTELVQQCGLRSIRLDRVDLNGGVFANAAALPSVHTPGVVVSETLLARLDPDETLGILAHELAHLEYYNPRRLRWARLSTAVLVLLSALVVPALQNTDPSPIPTICMVWPVIILGTMIVQARRRQKHETPSDLRAIALTANPEALIRALCKLHAFARLPRRWDTEFERNATHPSLARRIQAIRTAAGTAPAAIGDAASFTSVDGQSSVTFHDERLVWQESALVSHSIDYTHFSELRVNARATGGARLVAVDTTRRKWEFAVQPADVARLQAVLDIVDVRLGAPLKKTSSVASIVVRLAALLMMLISIVAGQYSGLMVGLLALLAPSPSFAAAAGAAAFAAGGIIWRDWTTRTPEVLLWLAPALAGWGLILIVIAIVNRREQAPPAAFKLTGVLAILVALALSRVLFGGLDALDLHHSARQWPGTVIFGLALAAALAFAPRRALRYSAAAVGAGAILLASIGSTGFVQRFGSDPLLVSARPMPVRMVTGPALMEFPAPFPFFNFWLSPGGRSVAFLSADESGPPTIYAGRAGGALSSFKASRAMFVDDHRVLLLDRQRGATVLTAVNLDEDGGQRWSKRFEIRTVDLSFDAGTEEWRLLGFDEDDIVSVRGRIGADAVREERWKSPADELDDIRAVAASRERVFALETHYRPWFLDQGPLWWFGPIVRPEPRYESRLWAIDTAGRSVIASSRLELACPNRSIDGPEATCTAYDGSSTRLFSVDSARRALIPLASFPGRLFLEDDTASGWLTGYWEWRAVAIRAATGEAFQVPDVGGDRAYHLAPGEGVLGAAWRGQPGATIVRVYALP